MFGIGTIQSFVKSSGVKSILQTKPQCLKTINPAELKYKPITNNDSFQKIKIIESWFSDTPKPFAKEGLTEVKGHHNFHGWNTHKTLEEEIRYIKGKHPDANAEQIRERIERAKIRCARREIDIYDTNKDFLKLMPQPHSCVVYRGRSRFQGEQLGSDFDVIKNAKIGDEIVPTPGFAYSAHGKAGAATYLELAPKDTGIEGLLIETIIPKGARVSVNMEHGGEVLFPGFSKYKLISKDTRYMKTFGDEYYKTGEAYPYTHAV